MKRNNRIITFILLLLCINIYSSEARSLKEGISNKTFEAEQSLRSKIKSDLKTLYPNNHFSLNLTLEINKNIIGGKTPNAVLKLQGLEKFKLPGLFIKQNMQESLQEVREIRLDTILNNIKSIDLELSTPHEITNKNSLIQEIKNIVSSNIQNSSKINIQVNIKKISRSFETDKQVSPSALNSFLKKVTPLVKYLWITAGILIILVFLVTLTINKSLSRIKNALLEQTKQNINKEAAPQLKNTTFTKDDEPITSSKASTDSEASSIADVKNYIELIIQIRAKLNDDYKIITEMIDINYLIKDFESILILLEIFPTNLREKEYEKMNKEQRVDIEAYLSEQGPLVYNDSEKLTSITIKVINLISLSLLKPGNFYNIFLNKIINNLPEDKTLSILSKLGHSEFTYIIENCNPKQLSHIASSDIFKKINWKEHRIISLTNEKSKNLIKKISAILITKDDPLAGAKTNILPYLQHSEEQALLTSLGYDESFTFKKLVKNDFDIVLYTIQEMNYEHIVSAFSIFEDDICKKILASLPELVTERLNNVKTFEKTSISYKIKTEIHSILFKRKHDRDALQQNKDDNEKNTAA